MNDNTIHQSIKKFMEVIISLLKNKIESYWLIICVNRHTLHYNEEQPYKLLDFFF
uniref:Uncharacterized protein n=1 Tax=Rhizophagus irregularis (strain DAOM 181602 / DAOM 197198 / MUCL 43194) TaxID=747089 RepID=U9T1B2_RHIID